MIEIDGVGVSSEEATLLRPVTFAVRRGEACAVRGRNGSGKSTLLRVLAGVRAPSTGSARIAGERIEQRDRRFRARVAAMIGLPPLAPELTVRDHLALLAASWGEDPDLGLLDALGIASLSTRYPHELSSGQTQLFGLSLVLARPAELLLLDEPEQRLDPERLDAVIGVLRERRSRGTTVVVATHSARLAETLADRELALDAA